LAVGTKEDPEIKKVYDVGVFAITSTASLFAYIWMYLCLESFSVEVIEMWEAWLTLAFFFILITAAWAADKLNAWHQDKKKTLKDKEEAEKKNLASGKKQMLRSLAKQHG
jgi:solute carrier family 8 (sodium/calcium exchanger)